VTQSKNVSTQILEATEGRIGVIELDSAKTLNSLTLDMVRAIRNALEEWVLDPAVAFVVISGKGEKAVCAGVDLQELYRSAISQDSGPREYAETFFFEEYQLDYFIHRFPKPIVCIGHGIVMGGGLGLLAGASHRIATETTRIAMPEITIGLFPDVGGTWFLSKMPEGLGLFFALTGAALNASDALQMRVVDHVIHSSKLEHVHEALQAESWTQDAEQNSCKLSEAISALCLSPAHTSEYAPSQLNGYTGQIAQACQQTSLGEVLLALESIDTPSKWYSKALSTLHNGSPLSSLLIYEQLRRYRYHSLDAIFCAELSLATNVVRFPEFAEGVRALLIDKDNTPKWQYPHFSAVPSDQLDAFFTPPWDINPLAEALAQIDSSIQQTQQ